MASLNFLKLAVNNKRPVAAGRSINFRNLFIQRPTLALYIC
jgi:hypothetical protein